MLIIEDLQRKTKEVVFAAGSLARTVSSFPENGDKSPKEKIALLNAMFAELCRIRSIASTMDDPIVEARIEIERSCVADKAALS